MNEILLIGRISNDLELKETKSGKYVNFNLAVNRQGEGTDFLPCVCFNQIAENITKYQQKGSLIALKGSLRQNEYTDKDGNKKYTFNVVASRIQFLGSVKDDATNISKTNTNSSKGQEIDDDDIPF